MKAQRYEEVHFRNFIQSGAVKLLSMIFITKLPCKTGFQNYKCASGILHINCIHLKFFFLFQSKSFYLLLLFCWPKLWQGGVAIRLAVKVIIGVLELVSALTASLATSAALTRPVSGLTRESTNVIITRLDNSREHVIIPMLQYRYAPFLAFK